MSEPGFLYGGPAGEPDPAYAPPWPPFGVPDADGWITLGMTDAGYGVSGEVDVDGTYVETRTDYGAGTETVHRSPPEWTIGDALNWLDPCPPRRTLSRWLAVMTPVGRRRLKTGGPFVRTYDPAQIMRRHVTWARRKDR